MVYCVLLGCPKSRTHVRCMVEQMSGDKLSRAVYVVGLLRTSASADRGGDFILLLKHWWLIALLLELELSLSADCL